MKYWGFYISEELKAETIKHAITVNESDSEYIRNAIELRNNIPIVTKEEMEKRKWQAETIPLNKSKEKSKMVQSFMKGGKI